MSTLPPPSPAKAEPIAEPDRLGPLATPQTPTATSYADGAAVRALVMSAIRDAIEPARAARTRVHSAPAAAVHDVRKALRRIRSILELVGGALPRRERKDIRAALVDARRSLGPARDLAVASDALVKVATAPELAAAAAAIVAAARADAPSNHSLADDVGRVVDLAEAQVDAIAAALPDLVRAKILVRGLIDTYRRARRARRKARRSDLAVHRWRRRSKELMYQLALFSDVGAAAELRGSLQQLDDQLGEMVDRLMLADFVGLYGHATAADSVGTLLTQLDDELEAHRDRTRKDSKALFATRPRTLRKRLTRAVLPRSKPDDGEAGGRNGEPSLA
jgi:CHAD domain-containing protein